jgi:hypothetical protein
MAAADVIQASDSFRSRVDQLPDSIKGSPNASPRATEDMVTGWLLKRKSDAARSRIFSSSNKRFFTLDYTKQVIFYAHGEGSKSVSLPIAFRDIVAVDSLGIDNTVQDVANADDQQEEKLERSASKSSIASSFMARVPSIGNLTKKTTGAEKEQHGFVLRTSDKTMELLCSSRGELEMWTTAMRKAIAMAAGTAADDSCTGAIQKKGDLLIGETSTASESQLSSRRTSVETSRQSSKCPSPNGAASPRSALGDAPDPAGAAGSLEDKDPASASPLQDKEDEHLGASSQGGGQQLELGASAAEGSVVESAESPEAATTATACEAAAASSSSEAAALELHQQQSDSAAAPVEEQPTEVLAPAVVEASSAVVEAAAPAADVVPAALAGGGYKSLDSKVASTDNDVPRSSASSRIARPSLRNDRPKSAEATRLRDRPRAAETEERVTAMLNDGKLDGDDGAWALDRSKDAHAKKAVSTRYADKGEGLSIADRLSQLEFSDDEDEDDDAPRVAGAALNGKQDAPPAMVKEPSDLITIDACEPFEAGDDQSPAHR